MHTTIGIQSASFCIIVTYTSKGWWVSKGGFTSLGGSDPLHQGERENWTGMFPIRWAITCDMAWTYPLLTGPFCDTRVDSRIISHC
ncbi:hypothetical protein CDAR_40991 [Caerostris darwini]|uniref:Uncharacterized protein n=1 Tax=Caerostris darwini TaxID=1538125 RepID=A0AAV4VHB2_9ARAC|nr:hypothetical protein CDAR_40991 [Caerostris darwini]